MAVVSARGGGAGGGGSANGSESLWRRRLSLGSRDGSVIGEAFRMQPGQLGGLLSLSLNDFGRDESGLKL